MAITRKSTSRRSFKPSQRKIQHFPQLGLNCGFDVRLPRGTGGIANSSGSIIGYLITDTGQPIIFG